MLALEMPLMWGPMHRSLEHVGVAKKWLEKNGLYDPEQVLAAKLEVHPESMWRAKDSKTKVFIEDKMLPRIWLLCEQLKFQPRLFAAMIRAHKGGPNFQAWAERAMHWHTADWREWALIAAAFLLVGEGCCITEIRNTKPLSREKLFEHLYWAERFGAAFWSIANSRPPIEASNRKRVREAEQKKVFLLQFAEEQKQMNPKISKEKIAERFSAMPDAGLGVDRAYEILRGKKRKSRVRTK